MTLFAPSDEAFAKVDSAAKEGEYFVANAICCGSTNLSVSFSIAWLQSPTQIEAYLRRHIIPGTLINRRLVSFAKDKDKQLKALDETVLIVKGSKPDASDLEVDGAKVIPLSNIECQRALIHTIDKVILPK
jgi:uncharacterized surface protein with fasciclin (FAS1) repeats